MSKTILQREVPPNQVIKLLSTGKTDLLDKFISKKGKPFKAFLKLERGGKVAFEFEPRAEGKPKGAAGGAGAKRGGARRSPASAAKTKKPEEASSS